MSHLVIRDVGETLVALLRTRLGPNPGIGLVQPPEVALASPVNAGQQGIRLTLFLYSIMPASELRNEPPINVSPGRQRRAPLPLDLYYLMTSTGRETIQDPTDRALDAHRLLGAAMQVMYDHGTLTGGRLQGSLHHETELRLTLQPITVEDLTRVWGVFPDSEYRSSVSYLVTPARITSQTEIGGQRVVETRVDADHVVATPAGAA